MEARPTKKALTIAVTCLTWMMFGAGCAEELPPVPGDEDEDDVVSNPTPETLAARPPLTSKFAGEKSQWGGKAPPIQPIYVTLVSQTDVSGFYQSLLVEQDDYVAYRRTLVERARMIHDHGAKLHLQVDEPLARAVEAFEGVWGTIPALRAETNGKNVLAWLTQDLGMGVDPRATGSSYNLADVAYLLHNLGVDSNVIGGAPLFGCVQEEGGFGISYLDWKAALDLGQGTIFGQAFPEFQWSPTVLSAPTMPGQAWGEFTSGVWRPGSGPTFGEHVGDTRIVYVGQGYPFDQLLTPEIQGDATPYHGAGYIKELAQKVADGFVDGKGPFTATLYIPDSLPEVDGPEAYAPLRAVLGELDLLQQEGKIVFATYPEVVREFEKRGSEASQVSYWSFSQFQSTWDVATSTCTADQEQHSDTPSQ